MANGSPDRQPVDIFSQVSQSAAPPPPATPPIPPHRASAVKKVRERPTGVTNGSLSALRRYSILMAVLVVCAALVAGAWYAWRWLQDNQTVEEETNTNGSVVTNSATGGTTAPISTEPIPVVDENVDQDRDGLSDTEETAAGTDPAVADTDGDALSDRDEVRIYTTNPRDSDTDGDSFLDGDEVRAGFNPSGSGDLLNLTQSLSTHP